MLRKIKFSFGNSCVFSQKTAYVDYVNKWRTTCFFMLCSTWLFAPNPIKTDKFIKRVNRISCALDNSHGL